MNNELKVDTELVRSSLAASDDETAWEAFHRILSLLNRLQEAHDKNIRKSWSTRQIAGAGHHCMWREAAEAMEQRSRAALEKGKA